MRIAIDASRTTRPQRTGTENYALQLIRAILERQPPHQIDLYFRDTPAPDLFTQTPNVTEHSLPWPRMWTHLRFAAALWRTRPDVTWVPAHTLPRFFPGRAVVTVHDLGYVHFPDAHPPNERRYLDWSTRYSAQRATRIMADSQATKDDLCAHYRIEAEKIHVVYPGHDTTLNRVDDLAQLEATRARYGLPAKYFLFIGTLQPRKNIGRLVRAFGQWRAHSGRDDIVLALGGKPGWLYNPAWTHDAPGVVELGYVADEDLDALYSGAWGFVFPSLYEGFGFPVLEAMRCGTPVLCSNTSSLPELAGAAALLVDPLDVDAIAAGLDRLAEDETLRANLAAQGYEQVKRFTWKKAAQQALHVLEEATHA
ncbi:MAG: glycosyltransferase family 4 protein [Anaerolineales bacterium]